MPVVRGPVLAGVKGKHAGRLRIVDLIEEQEVHARTTFRQDVEVHIMREYGGAERKTRAWLNCGAHPSHSFCLCPIFGSLAAAPEQETCSMPQGCRSHIEPLESLADFRCHSLPGHGRH